VHTIKSIILISVILLSFYACTNPFAPKFDNDPNSGKPPLSDLTTIEGVFQNLQYAYTFKDTLIYGQLLAQDFIFTYRDYVQGIDVSWGRDEEMIATYGLFNSAQRLDLIWNNIILSSIDSTSASIVRSFNLNVTFNPTDVIRVDGRVNLALRRDLGTQKWSIVKWIDESNF
jgi:hypothetical protein